MKKENITLSMEAEKLRATKRYMEKKDISIEQELSDALTKLYEKYVPAPVREYIDEAAEDSKLTTKNKPKKTAASPEHRSEVCN